MCTHIHTCTYVHTHRRTHRDTHTTQTHIYAYTHINYRCIGGNLEVMKWWARASFCMACSGLHAWATIELLAKGFWQKGG